MSIKWLDRDTVRAPYMVLCLTEAQYLEVVKKCNLARPPQWLDIETQMAVTHTWMCGGSITCVVCLHPDAVIADPIKVAAVLVHESVHVFQGLCDSIGEDNPSREFEAYSIERISERLMRDYVRQTQSMG